MEKLKAIFQCRACGGFVVADMQKGRDNKMILSDIEKDGILDDHCMAHRCPVHRMPKDEADKINFALTVDGMEAEECSDIRGVADLKYIAKIIRG